MKNIPLELVAGETTSWLDKETVDEQSNRITSADWALTYYFRGLADSENIVGVAEGTGWRFNVANDTFTAPGNLGVQAFLTKDTEKRLYFSGNICIKPDLSAQISGYDPRSQARKDLDAVQAAIRAIASNAVKSYTIGTRSVTKRDLPELIQLEANYRLEVQREEKADRIAQGLGNPNKVMVRFDKL